jgi:hypothetical protein
MKLLRRIQDRITGWDPYDRFVLRKRVLMETDASFVRRRYREELGLEPDWTNPRTFCEKITWLLLNYRPHHLAPLADKFEVRTFIQERIGSAHLTDMVGLYERAQEADWSALPDAFVLKATHGSKWNLLCPDKTQLNFPRAQAKMKYWLSRNFYWYGREWVYRDLKPRIIAECFLRGPDGQPPADLKFFCFNGNPRLVQVDADRFRCHRRSFYTPDWKRLPATMTFPPIENPMPAPSRLEAMLDICRRLAQGIPFVRVDLYDCPDRIVFGELTFLPGRGIEPFDQDDFNQQIGDWISLPHPVPDTSMAPRIRAALR